ncbi:Dnd system-associated protein 4 [Vibrio crassostreae]|uniref:hypothetical protein n=2 Tax=Vibrio TaxID=662 RepID=UPI0006326430|nr:hypothetical protein [Vibrio crassostreae]CAK2945262.1 Dnd system-associated protein 4 [Vibrio crassostreae]CAK3892287.1 Dnd system-associated protein 4 [Vibrio crassostreae]CDT46015.1 conserved hypothetical protein [Vibrio crassostreae]
MSNEILMKALFAQQRAQIIFMKSMNADLMSNAYVYAWMHGVYPVFQDGDNSVPDRPHESFSEHFVVSAEFTMEVIKYLDDLWLEDNSPTFYELEDRFGGKSNRCELLNICRYAYLDGRFDERLWDALLTKMKHPSEARSLNADFNEDDLYII